MPSRIQGQCKNSWTVQIFDWRREEKNTCEWVSSSGPKRDEKLSRRRTRRYASAWRGCDTVMVTSLFAIQLASKSQAPHQQHPLRVPTIPFRAGSPSTYNYGYCGELASTVARELGAGLLHLAVLPYCKHRRCAAAPHSLFQPLLTFTKITAAQWVLDWYPQGKTSIESRFNIDGKIGWATMESAGFITLLYIMYSLPKELGLGELPWGNWTMAGCFVSRGERWARNVLIILKVFHYLYRAVVSPLLLNPSMSPIHPFVWIMAFGFQMFNAISIGGYLAGYGPTSQYEWAARSEYMFLGLVIWCWGLLANMFHDDDLREIRRAADRKQRKAAAEQGKPVESVDKIYMIPKNGLFKYSLHAHYLCEWIEWAGWWMIGGWKCVPARTFLLNEVTTMLPRALQGKRWYEKKFGKDKLQGRKAIIPGVL